ncbi:MAG: ATP-binding protein [Oscillospiraceae bacterium]|nr:ATP-binding protein [Oscillospiraceae bacterium]
MVKRHQYLEKLKKLKDMQIIKVITGFRRCGKSTLLCQFQNYLRECGTDNSQIISINFEKLEFEDLPDYKKLYKYVNERLHPDKTTYIFLDEIQLVKGYQKAVDSLFVKENVDLYITGSNAQMLSGELATLLSGRFIEIEMLPLSFAEFYELIGGDRRDAWKRYFTNGGLPYTAYINDEEILHDYLLGIYNTVLLKDVVERNRIQDIPLLKSVIRFILDNIGNIVSSKKISDSLVSYGRKTTSVTVENYIQSLSEAYLVYEADRYDVKGKQYLKSLEKYYVVDIGLRKLLLGNKNTDIGHILENIVYLELLRRGYNVSIGKVDTLEIDFIAEKDGDKEYYQVSASVLDPITFEGEIAPLRKVNDNYPKYIITMDELSSNNDGIKQINVIDFLLQ